MDKSNHEKLHYVEFAANDLKATKAFFSQAFNWIFTDYGDDYSDFSGQGLNGGFYKSNKQSLQENGAALLIFYSLDLTATEAKVRAAGGIITQAVYSFPGGRRFHFTEPSGNEFAVWSED